MIDPTTAELALFEAEETCHKRLCDILGLTSGVDCFISTNPGKVECAVFDIGRAWTADMMGWKGETFHWRGQVDLYSRNRRTIQVWLMRMVLAMPIGPQQAQANDLDGRSNVRNFRIAPESDSVSEITTTELKDAANVKGVEVFTASVKFDIIFRAGPRD